MNYSPQPVTCQTSFYSDSGASLPVPFVGGSVSTRTDSLGAGADIHVQTTAGAAAALLSGWAQAQCSGPVKASLLYREYAGSVAQGEASVPATTSPATEFVTFAQTQTGGAFQASARASGRSGQAHQGRSAGLVPRSVLGCH